MHSQHDIRHAHTEHVPRHKHQRAGSTAITAVQRPLAHLLIYLQQLHVEDEIGAGRDGATRAPRAVPQLARDRELRALAERHLRGVTASTDTE